MQWDRCESSVLGSDSNRIPLGCGRTKAKNCVPIKVLRECVFKAVPLQNFVTNSVFVKHVNL